MKQKDIKILAIETSCDETSAAVVGNGRDVFSNIISSQISSHKQFGGVVPELASRMHIEKIDEVIAQAMTEANCTFQDLSAIAVTYGPGLVGALLVGVAEAKALAYALNLPLIPVHHISGHIAANYIEDKQLEPPFLCLVVSGGHTHLVKTDDYGEYTILGKTRDDAIGEAFDKIAREVGLGYPGGPKIDKTAKLGNEDAIVFPKAYLEEGSYDFSFSGVKSAVINYMHRARQKGESICREDLVASFQKAVTDVVIEKTMQAADQYQIKKIAMAGGVAANSRLRQEMEKACAQRGYSLNVPSLVYCTDNAAMIGAAAYYEYLRGNFADLDLNAVPNLKLDDMRE
ncbi:tRNA (adenosine(37)-N6)-threonylcarbamoyltransferase complex transferase subunit TsaD [Clostridiales bacterium COT073_COT-073]|nr:tRNA (adenosine(37)-N6)-threonylcarbamoyltransferase complex transferase subunit TsaD [Clostridiales bacterium COT073_COT-073]